MLKSLKSNCDATGNSLYAMIKNWLQFPANLMGQKKLKPTEERTRV